MDRYTTKRWLLRPLTAMRRRKRASRLDPFTLMVYEAHDYRPSMRHFFVASRDNPDILFDVDLPEGAAVLDVGGYLGEWTEKVLERADRGGRRELQVHAFEPEPHSFKRFDRGVGQDSRVHVHEMGLAGHDRAETIAIGGPGSSVFIDGDSSGWLGNADVHLRDAGAVLSTLGVERFDLVKINIEGGEFELLDRLHETGWMARMGTIIIQFHEFGPDAYRGRRRNRRQLAETHRCTWNHPWVYERWDPK